MKTKITIQTTKEIEITWVRISVPVDDDDMPADFPLRVNSGGGFDRWMAEIEVDTGKVRDWPCGRAEDVSLKVKDSGTYTLIAPDLSVLAEIHCDYVPNELIPGSYGDYIDLKIDSNGIVTNWPKNPNVKEFFRHEN